MPSRSRPKFDEFDKVFLGVSASFEASLSNAVGSIGIFMLMMLLDSVL